MGMGAIEYLRRPKLTEFLQKRLVFSRFLGQHRPSWPA